MSKQTPPGYEIQIITSRDLLQDIAAEWDLFLQQRAINYAFRQDPFYLNLHLQSIEQQQPYIVVLRKNNIIECIAPCILINAPYKLTFSIFRFRSFPLRLLKVFGSDFIFSKNADTNECIRLILAHIKDQEACDALYLENICETGILYNNFNQSRKPYKDFELQITSPVTEKIHRHKLLESYETWLASLRRKTRGTIRRHIRRLEKLYPGKTRFLKITSAEDVPEFLELLDDVYEKTWQAKTFGYTKRNTKHNIFYYQGIADRGWLKSYLLLIDNQAAAFIIGYQYNGIFEYSEPGYDPQYSKIGIGSVLNYHMLQDLYQSDRPEAIDFGFGENQYKRVLGNQEYNAFQGYITFNSRGHVIRLQRFLAFAEKCIRGLLKTLNLDRALRKILRKK
jgi:hypothetical protein